MKEKNIVYEVNGHYVGRDSGLYRVYHPTNSYAVSEVAFPLDRDGLSLAIMACAYNGGAPIRGRKAVELANSIHLS
jgi:hypothetical protein